MITIGGYRIDATLTEDHQFESEVTEYPVESGSAVTDNVRLKPIVVMLEGVVSDTPIGVIATARANQTAAPDAELAFLPSDDALAMLLAIRDAREPVSIESSLKTFDDMVMTNLSVPRDSETGHALRFSATFQQLKVVTNLRTTVQLARPTGLGNRVPKVVRKSGPINAHSRTNREIAWNDQKGRFEYADKAGQPGGTPVPKSDLPDFVVGPDNRAIQPGDIPTDTENHLYFDQAADEWKNTDGSAVTQRQLDDKRQIGSWWTGAGD